MIHHGDCLEILPTLPAESIDAIVTDPPYGLSFMGKNWDHGIPGVAFWSEAFRVAKPGTHLLAFGGTRTFHRLMCAIEDAGWEIRDCIMWVYGSGFPKSHNLKDDWQGWGTALKPAWEPIIVARKPLAGTVAQNVQQYGTGAVNVDGCRVKCNGDKLRGGSVGSSADGWDRPWKRNPESRAAFKEKLNINAEHAEQLGRWPANLIHDGSDEVVGLFPDSNGSGSARILNRGDRDDGWGMADKPGELRDAGSGSAARFFYCAKASKADRDEGCEGLELRRKTVAVIQTKGVACDGEWENGKQLSSPQRNHHPTVKPTALMRYLCRLVTPPSGTVLDPFCGSGSTGKAATFEGFDFIGIEREAEYVEIARARIAAAKPDMPLLVTA